MRAYRARRGGIPVELTTRLAWVRADGKRPIRPDGRPASSTNRGTWSAWADVQTGAGDGFGIMLGDGLGCYDLDAVTDRQAREFVATIPEPVVYVERSSSGRGVHVFVEALEGSGWRRMIDGVSVERYARSRFILMTGQGF